MGMTLPGAVPESAFSALALKFGEITIAAGRRILNIRANSPDVRLKPDASPVTIADEQAEDLILDALASLCPAIPVIAEEAAAAGRRPAAGGQFLLVDPLDGTREFIGGLNEFTVNIALISDGWPVTGAVYQPEAGRLWFGASTPRGPAGAFFQSVTDPAGTPQAGSPQPVSTRRFLQDRAVALVSRAYHDPAAQALLEAGAIASTRPVGSSLKFCLLAEGDADIYPRFGPTHAWDIAAGDAVLRAAGGLVVTRSGAPVRYGGDSDASPNFLAVGDPACVAELLAATR